MSAWPRSDRHWQLPVKGVAARFEELLDWNCPRGGMCSQVHRYSSDEVDLNLPPFSQKCTQVRFSEAFDVPFRGTEDVHSH